MGLPQTINAELLSPEEEQDAARGARRDQRRLNGIQAQIAVFKAGASFWAEALAWGRSRDLLSPVELEILNVAARIPQRTPTEKQSIKAIETLRKMQDEGYAAELAKAD